MRAAVIGMGESRSSPVIPDMSYKELMFEAAEKAYSEAGISPREVDGFICSSEDFLEGTSIFDEYVPDQLGAVLKPVYTISADGLYGVIMACLQVKTGADLVVVEAHSKFSEIVYPEEVLKLALDPHYIRPLGGNPHYIASLEATRFMFEFGVLEEDLAEVVSKNKRNALKNPRASFGANVSPEEILEREYFIEPLRKDDISEPVDVAYVAVIASERKVRELGVEDPVWIKGFGYFSETPNLDSRDWGYSLYCRKCAEMAFKMSKMGIDEIDFMEICDRYSYKELQHLLEIGITMDEIRDGVTHPWGDLPVNVSGGLLGFGDPIEASGIHSLAEAYRQIKGKSGKYQLEGVENALVQNWRGIPTGSGSLLILGR
ncbi:acetyl-CoA acetyltransferase [Thermococci archaeon]|nr:MAG: acetyl-CoA acetyltransferase [Thermococci archaeon]